MHLRGTWYRSFYKQFMKSSKVPIFSYAPFSIQLGAWHFTQNEAHKFCSNFIGFFPIKKEPFLSVHAVRYFNSKSEFLKQLLQFHNLLSNFSNISHESSNSKINGNCQTLAINFLMGTVKTVKRH